MAWASLGYVVPSDGSAAQQLVSDDVNGPAVPLWSADSLYVAFAKYGGGYDRCL